MKLNKVILFLTLSDVFTWGALTVINSFIAIYLANKLGANVLEFIGIGVACLNFFRGFLQIPFGYFLDKTKGQTDEEAFLFLGCFFMGLPFLLYPSIESPYFYYFLQALLGIGAAMNLVSWRKLFATNLSKGKEGLEYGIYETIMSSAMVVFSVVAGFVANISQDFFDLVIVTMGTLMIASGIWSVVIYRINAISKTAKKD